MKGRHSLVPWVGTILDTWDVTKLKHLADLHTGFAKDAGRDSDVNGVEVPYLRVANVQDGHLLLDDLATVEMPERDLPRYSLRPGDVLMNEGGDPDKLGRGAVWDGSIDPCLHQNHVFAVRPRRRIDSRWVAMATQSAYLKYYFESKSKKTTGIASISASNLMGAPIILPPPEEQDLIIGWLDKKTAALEALIEKKERLVALLEEKRQALITQAVTKGLDPTLPMKDSGVEWLGKIPAHWKIRRMTHAFRVGSGTTPRTDDEGFYGGGIPWVTTSELRETTIMSTAKSVTSRALHEHSVLRVYQPGSIAVAMYGATVGRVGQLGIPATVNQACCVFHQPSSSVSSRFAFYWFQMRRPFLLTLACGGGQPNLSQETLRSQRIPMPPSSSEQDRIADFIDAKLTQEDAGLEALRRSIDLLCEYRQALITAAVTGKIDVTKEATT